ncbi:MAG: hypothetical protein Q4D33_14225, partial [Prevotellaceae bacterium]|nr:hypothetical protein [Prevotellaceae bacterium]
MTNTLLIVAMRHHSFKDELTSLYERIVGCKVVLRKEDDNPNDRGIAVAGYFENRMLGYVNGNEMKTVVRNIIDYVGRPFVKCTVCRVLRAKTENESDMLVASLDYDEAVISHASIGSPLEPPANWSEYEWIGQVLPQTKSANQLQAACDNLYYSLLDEEPWTAEQQSCIDTIRQLSWADLSREMQERYEAILSLLTASEDSRLTDASDSLHQIIAHVGSPEVIGRVYKDICERCMTDKVKATIENEGYTIDYLRQYIPEKICQLLFAEPQQFVSRVWYLKIPRKVLQGIMSATVFLVRNIHDIRQQEADNRLPIRERTMKVGQIMDWSKNLSPEHAHEFCRFILLNSPWLNESDLQDLNDSFHIDISKGDIIFNDCEVKGNNIMEHITTAKAPLPPPLIGDGRSEDI